MGRLHQLCEEIRQFLLSKGVSAYHPCCVSLSAASYMPHSALAAYVRADNQLFPPSFDAFINYIGTELLPSVQLTESERIQLMRAYEETLTICGKEIEPDPYPCG